MNETKNNTFIKKLKTQKKFLFFTICILFLNFSGVFAQSVSLSTNAVYEGGTVVVYWSGFSGNVNLKFYKGSTFITYANTNVSGSGQQNLVMSGYEVRADYWVRVEQKSKVEIGPIHILSN